MVLEEREILRIRIWVEEMSGDGGGTARIVGIDDK